MPPVAPTQEQQRVAAALACMERCDCHSGDMPTDYKASDHFAALNGLFPLAASKAR
jgi:hypothetical protein